METRSYYQVRFTEPYKYSFMPHYAETLRDAEIIIDTANNLGTLEKWLSLGKSQENWEYWKNVYTNHTYIVRVIEIVEKMPMQGT